MNNTTAAMRDAVWAADACARPRVSWPTAPGGTRTAARTSCGTGTAVVRLDKRVTGATGTFGSTHGISTTGTTSITDPYRLGSPHLWRSN